MPCPERERRGLLFRGSASSSVFDLCGSSFFDLRGPCRSAPAHASAPGADVVSRSDDGPGGRCPHGLDPRCAVGAEGR